MKIVWSLLVKEIFSQKKLALFFVINLFLGFFGYLLLQVTQSSILAQTKAKAQQTLGGDLAITARRSILPEEIEKIEKAVQLAYEQKTVLIDFFAMAQQQDVSRLVSIRVVQDQFPLYGELTVKKEISTSQTQVLQTINSLEIYLDPELFEQLQITSPQTKIKLGQSEFTVSGVIDTDPTKAFRFGSFAPTVIIHNKDLAATKLLAEGSTMTTTWLYKIKNLQQVVQTQKDLERLQLDPSLRFETAEQDGEGANPVFKYLTDYLGLVALVSLGLSFLSLAYLVRWMFELNKKSLAIYKVLGLSSTQSLLLQILKNATLSVLAFIFSLGLITALLPLLQNILTQLLKIDLKLQLVPSQIGLALLVIILGPLLISFPTLLKSLTVSPLQFIRGGVETPTAFYTKTLRAWAVLMFLIFWGLAVQQSHSIKTGSLFVFGLAASLAFALLFLKLLMLLILKIVSQFKFETKHALLSLIRQSATTQLIVVTMTLAIVILTLLPHLKKSIINELRPEQSSSVPQLFMFDIQKDQVADFEETYNKVLNSKPELTPLVRSRILKVNDTSYERAVESQGFTTREQEQEARFRNRGVNLTYKAQLQDSEEIVAGTWFKNAYQPEQTTLPEISLEVKYAERIEAKIGDIMTFDVQGLEIKGQVTSLRRVRWTSFQPNFFIVFQPNVLEQAPQNFISSVSQKSPSQLSEIQKELVRKMPNVSVINVKQTVEKSLVYIEQMALALQVMAFLSLVVGLFIFIILVNTQARERLSEMNLLQVLGASPETVQKIFLKQFQWIGLFSVLLGIGLGLILAASLLSYVFSVGVSFDYGSILGLTSLLVVVMVTVLKWSLRVLKKAQPLDLLKANV